MTREPQENIGWKNVLPQHRGKKKTEAVVKSLLYGLTITAAGLDALRGSLDLNTAEGARLDLIGSIVGQTRAVPAGLKLVFFGYAGKPSVTGYGRARYWRLGEQVLTSYTAPDAEFRRMIRGKIALNNAHGTAPQIVEAMKAVYNAPASARTVRGGVTDVWVGRIPDPSDALAVSPERFVLPASGVTARVIFWDSRGTFGYARQHKTVGYGKGPYARTPVSNIYRIANQ